MATIQKFEDLKVWRKARELSQKNRRAKITIISRLDNKYFSNEQFSKFYTPANELTKMNALLITYLNNAKIKDQRFKESA